MLENPTFQIRAPSPMCQWLDTLRPRQNCRHFADDIFKCNYSNENVWISFRISLGFVLKVPFNNIPALLQIIACCRQGDKPLSEPMMVSLPTHICVTRPQWVLLHQPSDWNIFACLCFYWNINYHLKCREISQNLVDIFKRRSLVNERWLEIPDRQRKKRVFSQSLLFIPIA